MFSKNSAKVVFFYFAMFWPHPSVQVIPYIHVYIFSCREQHFFKEILHDILSLL